ncbi:MAG: hypothetical protein ACRDNX_12770, partial [Gaiellaceae bacterium]
RRAARRVRRFAALTIVASVLVVTLVLSAFGSGTPASVSASLAAPPSRLPPNSRPRTQIVALQGTLRLQLPIAQGRLTAIGYHATGDGALALEPLGQQGNRGLLGRLADRIFGGESSQLVYYRLQGGHGPDTASLDVGAAPDTDVFSPVDGTVIGITEYVINAQARGVRVDIQPASVPSLVVSLTRLRPDPALTVGSAVAAGSSRIGTVLDLSGLERQALARYTQDAGNHVSVEVHPAATLTLP